jgi:hypothetical protein
MRSILTLIILLLVSPVVFGQTPSGDHMKDKMGLFPPGEVQWKDGPASLQKGTKMAILEGDPTKPGQFTMRLWFPDGFVVSPHWHSQIEHVTVISGVLNFGMGDKFDRAATREMTAGTFGFWPIGMKHFAWMKGDTVLQLHGMGPWTVTYVNPADDPRKPSGGN